MHFYILPVTVPLGKLAFYKSNDHHMIFEYMRDCFYHATTAEFNIAAPSSCIILFEHVRGAILSRAS